MGAPNEVRKKMGRSEPFFHQSGWFQTFYIGFWADKKPAEPGSSLWLTTMSPSIILSPVPSCLLPRIWAFEFYKSWWIMSGVSIHCPGSGWAGRRVRKVSQQKTRAPRRKLSRSEIFQSLLSLLVLSQTKLGGETHPLWGPSSFGGLHRPTGHLQS